jgi:hypothetical protein
MGEPKEKNIFDDSEGDFDSLQIQEGATEELFPKREKPESFFQLIGVYENDSIESIKEALYNEYFKLLSKENRLTQEDDVQRFDKIKAYFKEVFLDTNDIKNINAEGWENLSRIVSDARRQGSSLLGPEGHSGALTGETRRIRKKAVSDDSMAKGKKL